MVVFPQQAKRVESYIFHYLHTDSTSDCKNIQRGYLKFCQGAELQGPRGHTASQLLYIRFYLRIPLHCF